MKTDRTGLETLTADDCLRLLRTRVPRFGRLGFLRGGTLHVLPVNYALDGADILVRTDADTMLDETADGAAVAFEVDEVDGLWQEGWSVLVKGRAATVDDDEELARVSRIPLRPWVPGDAPRYIRITAQEVTGRRIL